MSNDQELAQLVEYLRRNSGQYSLEALQRQLIDSGRDPGLVAQALEQVQAQQARGGPRLVWLWGLLLALANLVLLPLAATLMLFVFFYNSSSSWTAVAVLTIVPLLLVALELALGYVLLRQSWRRAGQAIVLGTLLTFVVPIVVSGLIFGICTVTIFSI
jgi:hypothetical protein